MFTVKPEMSDGALEGSYTHTHKGRGVNSRRSRPSNRALATAQSCTKQNQNYRNSRSGRRRDRWEELSKTGKENRNERH